jgi:hypothetical protein
MSMYYASPYQGASTFYYPNFTGDPLYFAPFRPRTPIDLAVQQTLGVASCMPEPIAKLMRMNAGIANWASHNPSAFEKPEFILAYDKLFGPESSYIAGYSSLM